MTPNTQARVWQLATATAYTAAKHMLFAYPDFTGETTSLGTRAARPLRFIPT